MQDVIADLARESLFIIEKVAARMIDHMRLLAMRHRDVGMLIEVVVQGAGPPFLGAGDDEIQALDFSFWSKHHSPIVSCAKV